MKSKIISGYARRWPRSVLDMVREDGKPFPSVRKELSKKGVYVLYRGSVPYYIGRSEVNLYTRICDHNQPEDDYYNFWDYFSIIVVSAKELVKDVEAVLIVSMPDAANRSEPRGRIPLPDEVVEALRKRQIIKCDH